MNSTFDVRAWNLVTGVALVAVGCGERVVSSDAGESVGEDESTGTEGRECADYGDCPSGYDCYEGVCLWMPIDPPDYYECYSDSDCEQFEVCEFGYCIADVGPSPDCSDPGEMLSFEVPDAEVLALSFADLDGDGRDELVWATQDALVAQGDGDPIVSTRTPGPITDMVAGDFDGLPGEDLLLVHEDALLLYSSNGDFSFAPATTSPIQLGSVLGLIAADFDGLPPTDLLAWGSAGAYIDVGGQVQVIATSPVTAAAAHEFGAATPGVALRTATSIDLYTLDGQLLVAAPLTSGPATIAAFTRGFTSSYVSLVHRDIWSQVQSLAMNGTTQTWSTYGTPTRIFAGKLDAGGTDDLVYFDDPVYFDDAQVMVQLNPQQGNDCHFSVDVSGEPIDAVFGDRDGDGDDELAILTDAGWITIVDGG